MTAVPATIEALEAVEVVYEDLPGWKQDISKVQNSRIDTSRQELSYFTLPSMRTVKHVLLHAVAKVFFSLALTPYLIPFLPMQCRDEQLVSKSLQL